MKNFYEKTDMIYPEKIIALEDFKYGTMVKCSIPILTPFLNASNIKDESIKLFKNNIDNRDVSLLGIDRYNSCNFIELFIPKNLCKGYKCNIPVSDDCKCCRENLDLCLEHECKHHICEGKQGEEFVGIFVGGDINKCSIIGRYDD